MTPLPESMNRVLINAQAKDIPIRFIRNRRSHGEGSAHGPWVSEDMGPINKVGGAFGDVGEIGITAGKAEQQIGPHFGEGRVRELHVVSRSDGEKLSPCDGVNGTIRTDDSRGAKATGCY